MKRKHPRGGQNSLTIIEHTASAEHVELGASAAFYQIDLGFNELKSTFVWVFEGHLAFSSSICDYIC